MYKRNQGFFIHEPTNGPQGCFSLKGKRRGATFFPPIHKKISHCLSFFFVPTKLGFGQSLYYFLMISSLVSIRHECFDDDEASLGSERKETCLSGIGKYFSMSLVTLVRQKKKSPLLYDD